MRFFTCLLVLVALLAAVTDARPRGGGGGPVCKVKKCGDPGQCKVYKCEGHPKSCKLKTDYRANGKKCHLTDCHDARCYYGKCSCYDRSCKDSGHDKNCYAPEHACYTRYCDHNDRCRKKNKPDGDYCKTGDKDGVCEYGKCIEKQEYTCEDKDGCYC